VSLPALRDALRRFTSRLRLGENGKRRAVTGFVTTHAISPWGNLVPDKVLREGRSGEQPQQQIRQQKRKLPDSTGFYGLSW